METNFKIKHLIFAFLAIFTLFFGIQNSYSQTLNVTIGKQVWMTQNLNVDKFRNGDPIPEAKTEREWSTALMEGEPAWCYYNNKPNNGDRYGKLYNWYAVKDPRGLAPEGWRIPSDEDWSRLTDFLGGDSVALNKMKFTDFWDDNDGESGTGTNESGFSGLPGGYRDYKGPYQFDLIGKGVFWWSSSEDYTDSDNKDYAQFVWIYGIYGSKGRSSYYKTGGLYVRCIRGLAGGTSPTPNVTNPATYEGKDAVIKYQTSMKPGDKLQENEKLMSANGRFQLRGTLDGNFIIEDLIGPVDGPFTEKYRFPLPNSGGFDKPAISFLRYGTDGNICIVTKQGKWYCATDGRDAVAPIILNKSVKLVLTDDGRLILVDSDGQEIWSTSPPASKCLEC